MSEKKIAVIGLGYVGLPLALALAKKLDNVVGFDTHTGKIDELRSGYDRNHEVSKEELQSTKLNISCKPNDLAGTSFFIVAVPTPVDHNNVPDLTPVIKASETVGRALTENSVVVYESTVYPGATEEICGPILEKTRGLKRGVDFKLGYSPERINPGDKEHTLETITKIVSGEDSETLERVAAVYGAIIKAGVYRAESIKVAEAAKVIENTQRDLNIALMNELSVIFDRIGIRTIDVLKAAGTKWNFLPFRPGLVGGHCIGVDPYYLTMKAQQLGYQPEVILAGRRINENAPAFVAQKLVKLLIENDMCPKNTRIGILGITFKENCNDIRNSKVPSIVKELNAFGVEPIIADPLANNDHVRHEYGLQLSPIASFDRLDGLIVAVAHKELLAMGDERIFNMVRPGGVVIDVKSVFDPTKIGDRAYWSL